MSIRYVRPDLVVGSFADADGAPIPYGHRYATADIDPPEVAYSVCRHPERFEPVAEVATALIEHLVRARRATRHDVVLPDGRRRVTLTPRGDGATLHLTLALEALPGVEISAGWRYRETLPDCGCDACDDDVLDLVEMLEARVLAIADGGFSEWRSGPDDDAPWHEHVRFDGAETTDSARWSAGEPEPIELPREPFRWPAW